jgi:hypothetical protein
MENNRLSCINNSMNDKQLIWERYKQVISDNYTCKILTEQNSNIIKSEMDELEFFIKRYHEGAVSYSERVLKNKARNIAKLIVQNGINIEDFKSSYIDYSEYAFELVESEILKLSQKSNLENSLKQIDSWWIMFEPVLKVLETTLRENLTKTMREIQNDVGSQSIRSYIDKTAKQNEEIEKLKKERLDLVNQGNPIQNKDELLFLKMKIDNLETEKIKHHPFSWLLKITNSTEEPKFTEIINKTIDDTIEFNKTKLKISIAKAIKDQEIVNVKQKSVRIGNLGFEGDFELKFKNGLTKTFRTQAVGAGGYNIQSFHYRYLCKLLN